MSATVCFRIAAPEGEREGLIADLYSYECLGIWEAHGELVAYFSESVQPEPLLALADPVRGIRVAGPEGVPDRDWEARWREGLAPRRVGPLWVRPSWFESPGEPELVIDPKQAFGSGEHATTRLALELVLGALRPGDWVLDVGTGSGILGLAALRCGAAFALGHDNDPVACRNAAENRANNELPLALYCGTLDALAEGSEFDLVVANMLSGRLLPWRGRLSAVCKRDLVLSGYLEQEVDTVEGALLQQGWTLATSRREGQSGDVWCAAHLVHD